MGKQSAVQGLFRNEEKTDQATLRTTGASAWSTRVLGFIGSAIICWIGLRLLAPFVAETWGINWLSPFWVKIIVTVIVGLTLAALLSRIEGTIWGKYYVIVGYLLSLALIVWIVLRLLHYV